MALKVGIVGLPNVGKSTLFNSLLKKRVALSANYPFATIEPNTGVVAVPDPRLLKLAELVKSEENPPSHKASDGQEWPGPPIVPAVVEFVDIAGLVKGASTGAGLGNQFLSHIREVDAIIHVLRDFDDANIVREGSTDPESDRTTIYTELALADLPVLEKLIFAQEKQAKVSKDPLDATKLSLLRELQEELGTKGLITGKWENGDERINLWWKTLPLLTLKPVLYVFNVDEGSYAHKLEHEVMNENEIVISARLEEELVELSDEEKVSYLKDMGIEQTGLERLIVKAYALLGLASFLTAGKKEVRAWTINVGSKAPQAAGVIHTDFEKKFIRAQVIEYEKLVEAGSLKAAKEKGWVRTEGKEYVMKDGDVVEFLIGS